MQNAHPFDYVIVDAGSAGRVLGGTSAINGMSWIRGHPLAFTPGRAQPEKLPSQTRGAA